MGNLYTHIVRHNDFRLETLSKLKYLWKNYPRDYPEIRRLQEELRDYENKHKAKPKTQEQIYGMFAWKAKSK